MIDIKVNRPIVVVAEEILQQLKELKAALNGANAAAAELAETLPQNITENKIEYRDASHQSATKKRKSKKDI